MCQRVGLAKYTRMLSASVGLLCWKYLWSLIFILGSNVLWYFDISYLGRPFFFFQVCKLRLTKYRCPLYDGQGLGLSKESATGKLIWGQGIFSDCRVDPIPCLHIRSSLRVVQLEWFVLGGALMTPATASILWTTESRMNHWHIVRGEIRSVFFELVVHQSLPCYLSIERLAYSHFWRRPCEFK